MGFADDMKRFAVTVETRKAAVFEKSCELAETSIRVGSALTGAPGQPVGQYGPGYHPGEVGGTLRDSWIREHESADAQSITTHLAYALGIEDATGPYGPINLRSTEGGFHSVKLTVAGWHNIVAQANADIHGFSDSASGYAGENGG